ncbi:SDR family oxidoreductase [candidate division KSB3 bacterium]|uniref:SDR family oxidoreductase n=1 Tax=candidate division KSB3 bacterium TaxID=2044937 RepID=A0A9D5JUC2_9BACT|nr:SDR family oxidoreductase [candidate division KSB3 bacterium]MBD3324399.1 SDR family oxidoreductase [candidate division KSB3 bacterium]
MDLVGKTAFVTGGSGDIGGAIARALAAAGVDVAISYVGHLDNAAATVDAVQAAGRRSLAIQLDQRDSAAIDAAVTQVVAEFGRVDILVNNAAWNIGIPFPDLDALTGEIWDRVLETNLRGPYLLARALSPHLSAYGTGRIVNIASTGGLYPKSSSIAYSVSKAGVIHLTRCLAVALAPNVTVNCIAPGLVEGTRMAQRIPEEVVQQVRRQVVLGRSASMQDIAEQVLTFCRAETITGQVLIIDGGLPGCMR